MSPKSIFKKRPAGFSTAVRNSALGRLFLGGSQQDDNAEKGGKQQGVEKIPPEPEFSVCSQQTNNNTEENI
jgi:hypothetical protein